jgi:LuxR family maltose regulon positive regulatory protein
LQQQLSATLPDAEIADLHRRACQWFAANAVFDEALRHAFAAGDQQMAVQIVVDYFPLWLETDNWRTINRRLNMFPAASIEQNPWLLVAKGHVLHLQYKWDAILPLLHAAETLLAAQSDALPAPHQRLLRGYLDVLWTMHWSFQTDMLRTQASAQKALQNLPEEHLYMRGLLLITLTIAQQASGDAETAERSLAAALARAASSPLGERAFLRPLMCLLSLYFAEGFVAQARRNAEALLQKATELQSKPSQLWAHLALGAAAYEVNDLPRAAHHYECAFELRYSALARAGHESLVGLALTHQAAGRPEAVTGVLGAMADFHQELVSPGLAAEAVSLQRRLAVLNGEADPGAARESGIPLRTSILYGWLETPAITAVRVALARAEAASLGPIEETLEQLLLTAAQLHKPGCIVMLLALKAVLHVRRNDRATALHVLRQAVALGEPRGLVRSVIDAGPQLLPLLDALAAETPSAYLEQLRAALAPSTPASASRKGLVGAPAPLPTPLTRREREVLNLLGEHLTDREIADTLVISPLTVRTHIENLSSKFAVHGRRAIVLRARERGLLS